MGFQLPVTPRLLTKLEAGTALAVMPAVFGISSLFLAIWTDLLAACAMKFSDNGLQYASPATFSIPLSLPVRCV